MVNAPTSLVFCLLLVIFLGRPDPVVVALSHKVIMADMHS